MTYVKKDGEFPKLDYFEPARISSGGGRTVVLLGASRFSAATKSDGRD